MPIAEVTVEVAQFDIQKIKDPSISGAGYQHGEMEGWNTREYVLFRDGHTCRHCHGKSGDPVLNVHHIESRKMGGNAPNNLVTLCMTCHQAYHTGEIELDLKRGPSFRDAAFMNVMRWKVYEKLKDLLGVPVHLTYGYVTKHRRTERGIPKSHIADARMASGNYDAAPGDVAYRVRKVRRNNRQIHKANLLRRGKKKDNQAAKYVFGFRLFDEVEYDGEPYFVFGRRTSGYFDIRTLDGEKVNNGSVGYKKLRLLKRSAGALVQAFRPTFPPPLSVTA